MRLLTFDAFNEAIVGEQGIDNLAVYLSRMEASIPDKIFWLDKVDFDVIVDFGCADGILLESIRPIVKGAGLIGYDIDSDMIRESKSRLGNRALITDNWEEVLEELEKYDNPLVLISSVVHEIYSYTSQDEIQSFWSKIFSGVFNTIVIRDMLPSSSAKSIRPNNVDVQKIRNQISRSHLLDRFEDEWGSISENYHNFLHYLLKYHYEENYDREVKENYFPITFEEIKTKVPDGYKIVYQDNYLLPYIKEIVESDYDVILNQPSHGKLIIRRDVLNESFIKFDGWKWSKWDKALAIAALLTIGYKMTPHEAKVGFIKDYIGYRLEHLHEYQDEDGYYQKAKEHVKEKVLANNNIINKSEIIERIDNCLIKLSPQVHIWDGIPSETSMASYIPNGVWNEFDFIIVGPKPSKNIYINLVHELNHLVDDNSKLKQQINWEGIINKDITKLEYERYFQDWPVLTGDSLKAMFKRYDHEQSVPKKIRLSQGLWKNFNQNRDYYCSNEEVYARLSSMKNFMINNNIIDNASQQITEEDVENMKNMLAKQKTEDKLSFIDVDFMILLPLINWDKCEEINLFASIDIGVINNLA